MLLFLISFVHFVSVSICEFAAWLAISSSAVPDPSVRPTKYKIFSFDSRSSLRQFLIGRIGTATFPHTESLKSGSLYNGNFRVLKKRCCILKKGKEMKFGIKPVVQFNPTLPLQNALLGNTQLCYPRFELEITISVFLYVTNTCANVFIPFRSIFG